MNRPLTNINIMQLEAELREEKSRFAKAFHGGKSMSELREVVEKIHMLEKKFSALVFKGFNKQ
jgi:hypothetical protein